MLGLLLMGIRCQGQLPEGWSNLDIGSPGVAGSASYNAGIWTVEGGGSDIWGTYDQFHFVCRLSGPEAEIMARVETQEETDSWAKAGVMFRDSTAPSAAFAMVVATPGNGVNFQWRPVTGGEAYNSQIAGLSPPYWVRLVRAGDTFTGYWSGNGESWTSIGTGQVVSMNPAALAGLCVTAHNNNELSTSTFSNVSATNAASTLEAPFGIYRELWTSLSSSAPTPMDALTNTTYNPNWPDRPVTIWTRVLPEIETGSNTGMNEYGQRLRGFVVPPMSGSYVFQVASDDSSVVYLSSGEAPGGMQPIAWVSGWTNPREWFREASQTSAPIQLEQGQRYYLEALMRQGYGGDNFSLRWILPDGTIEEPIPGLGTNSATRVVPCSGLVTPPGIYEQTTNGTVMEGVPMRFQVLSTNRAPVAYQWRINGTNVPGPAGLASVLVVTNPTPALHQGLVYACVLSNAAGVITSAPVTLNVLADTIPPECVKAFNLSTSLVQIVFSEPLAPLTATNPASYRFTNGLAVSSATLSADGATVLLATAPLSMGSNYSILLTNLYDRASVSNRLAPGTQVSFLASPFAVFDVGSPSIPAGGSEITASGLAMTAGGAGIGGSADQFGFACQMLSGDFDLRGRVGSFVAPEVWAKAGLMARESVDPKSRFAAVFSAPAMHGTTFEWRDATAGNTQSSGSFPPNYPHTWVRLKRAGNVFTGYAGFDGTNWTQLGSATLALPSQIYVGWALSSQNAAAAANATFADQGPALGAVLATVASPYAPPGPSSRKTPIAITEIMYKPASRSDTNNLEFIEIFNSNPWFHDLSGYRLVAEELTYTFPPNSRLDAGAFLVIAASPESIRQVYGVTNVTGPYTGSLKKSDTLKLLDELGSELLIVPYSSDPPWPAAPHGAGHSLVLAQPSYGERDVRAWAASDIVGGSPGQMEAFRPSPLRNVMINEILAHTDLPQWDYIELYNHSTQAVNLAGCTLSDDPATNKYVIPPGTIIPARGFLVFYETNLNFALNAAGETIYFRNPEGTRVLDALRFEAQENGVAYGRWPDGASEFYRLESLTPGAANAAIRRETVVINEIMYNSVHRNDDWQYVELHNRSTNGVNLGNWRLGGGISYQFPPDTFLGPGGYLVVARNASLLRSNYAQLNLTNCLGDFSGRLAHSGERIVLTMPDVILSTNELGVVTTNKVQIPVNEVDYQTGGAWGQWSDGGGSSLELIDPAANNRLGANWADSDETQKSAWITLETTGVLDHGNNYDPGILYGQLGLLDTGECLVDGIEVRAGTTGQNLVANPDFETGSANWWMQGNHSRSSRETGTGYLSSGCLHVRASNRMWTGDNSCQFALLSNTLQQGQTATLRLRARWLKGAREILLRLNGNWLEVVGPMDIPRNLGTPGARNSRAVTAAPPAIYEVTHSPSLPAGYQPAVVTARFHSAYGLRNAYLYYRVDPSASYTAVALRDTGTGGDWVANDGVFSGTIPGQPPGTLVAFYVDASDNLFNIARYPALFDNTRPVRECLIRFGDPEPGGSFAAYHLWISQTNVTRWSAMSDLSNELHDGTFVSGSRVIYNVEARFAGSPYHQGFDSPAGNLCHYKWVFPDDNKFLGASSFNKLHQPGNGAGDDLSLQREQIANSFLRRLGVPWLNRRHVAVFVNGVRRGTLMEDAQTPDDDIVEQWFPDDDEGWLYKMQPWFEFGPFPTGSYVPFNNASWCNLMPYTTTGGVKKTARYRYNFLVRQTPSFENDYTNVFSLIDAASTYGTPGYAERMEHLANMENWMRVFAANHAAGNWDAFGCPNAQNLYGYVGTKGTRYSLLMFDFNIVIGNGSWGPGESLFAANGQDPNTQNIYNEPVFRRMYWRALEELVNGPLDVSVSGPLMDAKYKAFAANGLQVENPNASIKNWLTRARSSIANQLGAANATSFTVNPGVTLSNNVAFLTGQAPVSIKSIRVNGAEWPLTWTDVKSWRIAVPLVNGSNYLSVVGVDINGQPVAGASNVLSAIYSGALPAASNHVVISEIQYAAAVPGAEFVELFNTSTNVTFDLSNLEVRGVGYTFPPGATIGPGEYRVLAANLTAFAAAYGAAAPVYAAFGGTLQPDGETLTLLWPASGERVTRVKYRNGRGWPAASQWGSSLQLRDMAQDNWRPGNWAMALPNTPPEPQWVFVSSNVTVNGKTLLLYLGSAGEIFLDDLSVTQAGGANRVVNGDFESPLAGTWTLSANFAQSRLDTSVKHSGNSSLRMVATAAGTGSGNAVYQTISSLATGQQYTISFWFLQTTNGGPLTVRFNSSPSITTNPAPPAGVLAVATPGAPNSVAASLDPFPPLFLNEIQAENLSGPTNGLGQRVPWVELYNAGTQAVSLAQLCLANNYTNLAQWSFPTGTVIPARGFKVVFADGQSHLSTSNELHANFTLPPGAGDVVLSRLSSQGQLEVLDILTYAGLQADRTFGSIPDGQSFDQRQLFFATPGATNNPASPAIQVFINEWMADNTRTLADPADNDFEDWFELYNAGPEAVDLGGFYLTDNLTNKFQYQVPATGRYVLPPGGFLLVWADGETGQNNTNRPDLHVNFKLDKQGEAIGLFGADGAVVDVVTFGPQATDVSMGRSPDGGSELVPMAVATPRTNNFLPNTAPSLPGLPDRYVYLGETLAFRVVAADADLPPQTLLFSLEPGSPPAATIEASTGDFLWQPGPANLGTNPVTIRVTDNGTPPMSATTTFAVVVLGPPTLERLQVAPGTLRLSWFGYPGRVYRLEFKPTLEAGPWSPAGPDLPGAGAEITVDIDTSSPGPGFYRLRLVQ